MFKRKRKNYKGRKEKLRKKNEVLIAQLEEKYKLNCSLLVQKGKKISS